MTSESLLQKMDAYAVPDNAKDTVLVPSALWNEAIEIIRRHEAEPQQDEVERVAMALAARFCNEAERGVEPSAHTARNAEDVGIYAAEHWGEFTDYAKDAIAAMPNSSSSPAPGIKGCCEEGENPSRSEPLNPLPKKKAE